MTTLQSRGLAAGFACGVGATVAMSVVMLVGTATGASPMPKPVPLALVEHVLGGAPKPALVLLAVAAHLGYGGAAGALLAALARRTGIGQGLAYGVVLWLIMGLLVLPFLGWGPFGTGITPKIAMATLILHLIYGTTLGWLLRGRRARASQPQATTPSPAHT